MRAADHGRSRFKSVGGKGGTTESYGPYRWEARHIPALEPTDSTGIASLLNGFGITRWR